MFDTKNKNLIIAIVNGYCVTWKVMAVSFLVSSVPILFQLQSTGIILLASRMLSITCQVFILRPLVVSLRNAVSKTTFVTMPVELSFPRLPMLNRIILHQYE